MEYNLIKINQLDETSVLNNDDFIVADIKDDPDGSSRGKFLSRRIRVRNAFCTHNIRLSRAGEIVVDLNNPIFDDEIFDDLKEELKNDITTQSEANVLFTTAIQALMEKVKTLPNIIMAAGPNPPERDPDPTTNEERLYPEGSLWIDTNTFRTYVYFFDRDTSSIGDTDLVRHWVSLTDR